MITDAWTERLSEYLDGDLAPAERTALEQHLAGCAACASTLAELAAVVERARALVPRMPRADLWPGIAAGIGAHGRADVAAGVAGPIGATRRPPARRVTLSLPQLAAASLVLAVGSGLVGRFVLRGEPDEPAPLAQATPGVVRLVGDLAPPPGYAEELSRLELALAQGRDRLDPNTVRILEKNLAVIDRAIRESQEALAVDPGNPFLAEHLERAYRGKVDYLREATALLTWGI